MHHRRPQRRATHLRPVPSSSPKPTWRESTTRTPSAPNEATLSTTVIRGGTNHSHRPRYLYPAHCCSLSRTRREQGAHWRDVQPVPIVPSQSEIRAKMPCTVYNAPARTMGWRSMLMHVETGCTPGPSRAVPQCQPLSAHMLCNICRVRNRT